MVTSVMCASCMKKLNLRRRQVERIKKKNKGGVFPMQWGIKADVHHFVYDLHTDPEEHSKMLLSLTQKRLNTN